MVWQCENGLWNAHDYQLKYAILQHVNIIQESSKICKTKAVWLPCLSAYLRDVRFEVCHMHLHALAISAECLSSSAIQLAIPCSAFAWAITSRLWFDTSRWCIKCLSRWSILETWDPRPRRPIAVARANLELHRSGHAPNCPDIKELTFWSGDATQNSFKKWSGAPKSTSLKMTLG